MKKNFKKIVSVFTLAFTLQLLTACADNSDDTVSAAVSVQTAAESESFADTEDTAGGESTASSVSGIVRSVAEDKIVIEEMQRGGMREKGELPSEDMPEGEPPEPPQGNWDGEPPADMPQDGKPGNGGRPENENSGNAPVGAEIEIALNGTENVAVYLEGSDGLSEGDVSDIAAGAFVSVDMDESGCAVKITVRNGGDRGKPDGAAGGFFGDGGNIEKTAAAVISEDGSVSGESYSSGSDDENALRIDGAAVTLDNIHVAKSGGASNIDNGNFYGVNAALLAENGAEVTIENSEVTSSASAGNGIFSYGSGTVVTVKNTVIRTEKDNSGGIQTAGGGTTYARDLDIATQGNSSAAIRSDRGGGIVEVDGGSYITSGTGSPAIYSTADITVKNAVLTAESSEAVVVEGKNSAVLENCTVSGKMSGTYNDESENIHNIMIYQSMSGDAEQGKAYFEMTGGSLEALSGDMIYVTNTACKIKLSGVALTLADDTLLNVSGNDSKRGWGRQGENGGDAEFTADAQQLEGNILVDEISSADISLENGTVYKGAVDPDGAAGEVNVRIDSASVWELTADSYVSSVENAGTIKYNGYKIYLADGTVAED